MLGLEMRRPSSKFSSPGQEASITSTRLTIRARRQTEVDHTDSRDAGRSITRRARPWLAFRALYWTAKTEEPLMGALYATHMVRDTFPDDRAVVGYRRVSR